MAFSTTLFRQTSTTDTYQENVKDIEKCSFMWFKQIKDNDNLKLSSFQDFKRVWSMFYILNNNHPVLELFTDEQKILQKVNVKESIAKISLNNCLSVTRPILDSSEKENNNEFVISLENQILQIYVENRELVDEWVSSLRSKLSSLNVFSSKDNVYSKEPCAMNSNKNLLNRPLPPLPNQTVQEPINTNQLMNQPTSNRSIERIRETLNRRTINDNRTSNEFTNASSLQTHNQIHPTTSSALEDYERLPSNNYSINADQYSNYGSDYSSSSSYRNAKQLTLRESQVLTLTKEINNRGGVKLRLRKVDCLDSIAIVEWLGRIYIVGYKQKYYPSLHNAFHIGDEIISINGFHKLASAKEAYFAINECDSIVEFLIRRCPYGKVFLIKREHPNQDLGIVREGNTAEIIFIEPNSLASRYGISNQTVGADPLRKNEVNWYLTEINFRPLNLFFKNDEIKTRLNCVGNEISILIQPIDLIKNLRKKLKLIKNYKDYIVQ